MVCGKRLGMFLVRISVFHVWAEIVKKNRETTLEMEKNFLGSF